MIVIFVRKELDLLKNGFEHISCIEDLSNLRGRLCASNANQRNTPNYTYGISMFLAKSMRFVFLGVFLYLSGVISVSAESSWSSKQNLSKADLIIKSPSEPDIKTVINDVADYGLEFKKISKEIEGEIYKKLSLIIVGEEIDVLAAKPDVKKSDDSWSVLQSDSYKNILSSQGDNIDISPNNIDIASADGFKANVGADNLDIAHDADKNHNASESSFIPLYEEMLEHDEVEDKADLATGNSDWQDASVVVADKETEVVIDKKEIPFIDISKNKSEEKTKNIQLASLSPNPVIKSDNKLFPDWKKYAIEINPDKKITHYIAVIIDDMGLDLKRTSRIADLPAPLTLSYLSYARHLDTQTKKAHDLGHELMVHMPMEPNSKRFDPGPNALMINMNKDELGNNIDKMLASFTGYVGVNNHMGSKFTRNKKSMGILMAELKKRGLLFVDSQTTPNSAGIPLAKSFDVPYATRNVFIDNLPSKAYALQQLKIAEKKALKNGFAVAIGHPRDGTIEALKEWLPSLKEKNIQLVPISYLVKE